MQVKVVDKKESEIRNALQEEIIKAMDEFKKSLEANDSNIRLNFIKLLGLGMGFSSNIPYRKDLEEEKFNLLFEKSIELFLTSDEPLDMDSISRILKMFGKVPSAHIMRNFIDMNFDLIVGSNIELSEVPNYYMSKLARARKMEESNLEGSTIRTK